MPHLCGSLQEPRTYTPFFVLYLSQNPVPARLSLVTLRLPRALVPF